MMRRAITILMARPAGYGITVTASAGTPHWQAHRLGAQCRGLRDPLIVGVTAEHHIQRQPSRARILTAYHLGNVGELHAMVLAIHG